MLSLSKLLVTENAKAFLYLQCSAIQPQGLAILWQSFAV